MIDTEIHLGDVIATAAITALGIIIRRAYKEIGGYISRLPRLETRVDEHAKMIDFHSARMIVGGWIKPGEVQRLGRRREDVDDSDTSKTW